jgi:transcription antitermination factor NusG
MGFEKALAPGVPPVPEVARAQWYALRVRSNFEDTVSAVLAQKSIHHFLPVYRVRHRWSDRVRDMALPLFPGYLFCNIELSQQSPVLTTRGVVGIVSAGRNPIAVSAQEIAALRTMVESSVPVEPWPFLNVGQRVRIRFGPLAGMDGILVKVKNAVRVVVSISLLGRSAAAEVDASWIGSPR